MSLMSNQRPPQTAAPTRPRLAWQLARQARVRQWIKNLLVFLPVIAGQQLSFEPLLRSFTAFVAFCCTASAVYVFNDLMDLRADRAHPTKRRRPLAAGALSVRQAVSLMLACLGAGGLLCVGLPVGFAAVVALYLLGNLAYSLRLKRVLALDVVMLAGMYAARITGGGFAAGIPVSEWLLAFAIFFFSGLANLKRFTEVQRAPERRSAGRAYRAEDAAALLALGVTTSLLSILVLALYLHSKEVELIYGHPERLYGAIPVMVWWTARIWLLGNRNEVEEDPVVFAATDKVTWGCVLAIAALGAWAR